MIQKELQSWRNLLGMKLLNEDTDMILFIVCVYIPTKIKDKYFCTQLFSLAVAI